MLYLRSGIFLVWFIAVSVVIHIVCLPALLFSWRAATACGRIWAKTMLWGLKVFCRLKYEVRGTRPHGAVLVAAKHYSMWETIAGMVLLDDPAIVLKRELLNVPLYGWYAQRMEMIPIERSAGASAIRALRDAALRAKAQGRTILIFPEGTRRKVDAPPDYKPGAAALYTQLELPCVPMAHNSGLFWTGGGWVKKPGTIVVEFLPVIPPGLRRREFAERLENAVEIATSKLLAEGRESLARNG